MKMKDRTDEFIKKACGKASSVRSVELDSIENETSNFVNNFLIKVEEIYDLFDAIDKKIKEMTDLQTALLEFSEKDENLFIFYEEIKRDFFVISAKITELEGSIEATNFFRSETELRICNTQLLTLKRKLNCSVSNYYNIQEDYKEKCKERVIRQAEICGADIAKIDFDAAMESKTNMFLEMVFPDFNVAHHYMNQIKKRHEEFLRLERSLVEVRDLFFDMELIVRADNSLIQRIDKHAEVVGVLVAQGIEHTKDYRKSLKIHKFKKYICFCCIGFIVLVVGLTILTTFA